MKHGKKPTMSQKQLLKSIKLDPANWLVVKDTPDEVHIVHRTSGRLRKYKK